MSRALAQRVGRLEAQREARLLAAWERLSPVEQHSLIDAVVEALIRQGMLPAPDPTQPQARIAALRLTAPDVLRAWHQATAGNAAWRQAHPEVLSAFYHEATALLWRQIALAQERSV